jgi:hypothetical protein
MSVPAQAMPAPAAADRTVAAGPDRGRAVPFGEIAPMMQLSDLMAPMAIRVAATLRLSDLIAGGTTDLSGLASAAGVDPSALRRLLRYLAARGVYSQPQPGTYQLTDLARLLLDDHPARLRARFDLTGPVGRGDLSFIHLLDSIRTGQPSFARMYGRSFWEDLNSDPRLAAEFTASMAANAAHSGLDHEYDWSAVETVVDVGGGDGTLISELLAAHPHLTGTLVELPATAEQARAALARSGLAQRCEVVAGSFFDPLPAGADVYMLGKVLHDWGDAEAEAILRRCAQAAGREGRVLIIEMVLEGGQNEQQFSYLDLHMLVYFGGKERTFDEYRDLAGAVGLQLRAVGRGKWGTSVLEGRAR